MDDRKEAQLISQTWQDSFNDPLCMDESVLRCEKAANMTDHFALFEQSLQYVRHISAANLATMFDTLALTSSADTVVCEGVLDSIEDCGNVLLPVVQPGTEDDPAVSRTGVLRANLTRLRAVSIRCRWDQHGHSWMELFINMCKSLVSLRLNRETGEVQDPELELGFLDLMRNRLPLNFLALHATMYPSEFMGLLPAKLIDDEHWLANLEELNIGLIDHGTDLLQLRSILASVRRRQRLKIGCVIKFEPATLNEAAASRTEALVNTITTSGVPISELTLFFNVPHEACHRYQMSTRFWSAITSIPLADLRKLFVHEKREIATDLRYEYAWMLAERCHDQRPEPLQICRSLRNLHIALSTRLNDTMRLFPNLRTLEIDTRPLFEKATVKSEYIPLTQKLDLSLLANSCPLLERFTISMTGYAEERHRAYHANAHPLGIANFERLKSLTLHVYNKLPQPNALPFNARRLRMFHQDLREHTSSDSGNVSLVFWLGMVDRFPRVTTIHTDCAIDGWYCADWWNAVAGFRELAVVNFIRRVAVKAENQDECHFFGAQIDRRLCTLEWIIGCTNAMKCCTRLVSVGVPPGGLIDDFQTRLPARIRLRTLRHQPTGPMAESAGKQLSRCCCPY
jgi:hypothetical protein